jgi:hypothetical protein
MSVVSILYPAGQLRTFIYKTNDLKMRVVIFKTNGLLYHLTRSLKCLES